MIKLKLKFVSAIVIPMVLATTSHASADVYVKGYFRKDGTYVSPHFRTEPDGNFFNNYSTFGNINPYTGVPGMNMFPNFNYSSRSNTYEPPTYNYDYNSNNFLTDDTNDTSIDVSEDSSSTDATKDFNPYVDGYINDEYQYLASDDTDEQFQAKSALVDYFNKLNIGDYSIAYDFWNDNWKTNHSLEDFKYGYKDVTHYIDYIYAVNNSNNGITLTGTFVTKEGLNEENHQYKFKYKMENVNGKWQIEEGRLKKLW